VRNTQGKWGPDEVAQKAAHVPLEQLLLELWAKASDSARMQALTILSGEARSSTD